MLEKAQWGPCGCWGLCCCRQAQKAADLREPSQEPSPALLYHGLIYHQQCGWSQGEPGQLPPTPAEGLTCQLSQFGAATAMGHSWKPRMG